MDEAPETPRASRKGIMAAAKIAIPIFFGAAATAWLETLLPRPQAALLAGGAAVLIYFLVEVLRTGPETNLILGLVAGVLAIVAAVVTLDPQTIATAQLRLASQDRVILSVSAAHQARTDRDNVDIATLVKITNASDTETLDAALAPTQMVLLTMESRDDSPNAPQLTRIGGSFGPRVWVRTFRPSEEFCDPYDATIKHLFYWQGRSLAPGVTLHPNAGDVAMYRHWPTPKTLDSWGYNVRRLGLLGLGWVDQDGQLLGFTPVEDWDSEDFAALVANAPAEKGTPAEVLACGGTPAQ